MKITQKLCAEGEMLPAWYGFAWYEYERNASICYPVPFNHIARVARSLWILLRCGSSEVRLSPRDAYHQGLKQGRAEMRAAFGVAGNGVSVEWDRG